MATPFANASARWASPAARRVAQAALTVTSGTFGLLLIPTILNPAAQVPLETSLPTAALLLVNTGAFAVLGMPRPAASTFVAAAAWLVVAALRGGPA